MNVFAFDIKYVRHAETGLIVAYSPDHKGIMVHGRTLDEVKERIPAAARAIFEAEGNEVISVHQISEDEIAESGFIPSTARFNASLVNAT